MGKKQDEMNVPYAHHRVDFGVVAEAADGDERIGRGAHFLINVDCHFIHAHLGATF